MKTKIEQLQQLLNTANAIKTATYKYKVEFPKEPRIDKTGFGFNLDDRFSACKGFTLHVDSWVGSFGNSGCGTILDVDTEIFNKHLLKVLGGNFWRLLEETENSIRQEALTLKEEASRELSKKLEEVNAL